MRDASDGGGDGKKMAASSKLALFVRDMQANPSRAMAYGSLIVGSLLLLFTVFSVMNALGVFGGKGGTEVVYTKIGTDVTLYSGALKVRVTGVQKRPLSVFGPVSSEDANVTLVALQVDAEVSFFRNYWIAKDSMPLALSALLQAPRNMKVTGVNKNGQPGSWSDFVNIQKQATGDPTVYDLQNSQLPPDTVKLPGSFVFKVPIDATDLVLTLSDYGADGKGNADGTPFATYSIPLDAVAVMGE